MNPLINLDIRNPTNFWVLKTNTQFLLLPAISKLHKSDKSKDKVKSSNIMWAIALLVEREENVFSELPTEERVKIIGSDFIGDKSFTFENLGPEVDEYTSIRLSQAERSLASWRDKLNERDKFISEQKYTEETYEMLDKLMGITDKLFKQYYTIEKEVLKEKAIKDVGDRTPSLLDEGKLM